MVLNGFGAEEENPGGTDMCGAVFG
jgi:hypothetical protein